MLIRRWAHREEDDGGELWRNRRRGIMITVLIATVFAVIIIRFCLPLLEIVETPQDFQDYIRESGAIGVIRFFVIMVLQTLTMVIPAGPFEIASGAAFGVVRGTIICDLAILCGNMIAFSLSKTFGMKYVSMFVPREKIERHNFSRMTPQKKTLAALIFLIPGFPKDQMTYILGLSDLSWPAFALLSGVLRLPTIILQVLSGDTLVQGSTEITVVLITVSSCITAAGALYYVIRYGCGNIRGKHDDNEERK